LNNTNHWCTKSLFALWSSGKSQ